MAAGILYAFWQIYIHPEYLGNTTQQLNVKEKKNLVGWLKNLIAIVKCYAKKQPSQNQIYQAYDGRLYNSSIPSPSAASPHASAGTPGDYPLCRFTPCISRDAPTAALGRRGIIPSAASPHTSAGMLLPRHLGIPRCLPWGYGCGCLPRRQFPGLSHSLRFQ